MRPPPPPKIKPKQHRKAADMTLRDHIAIEAMRSMIIANNGDSSMISLGAAIDVYQIADYMIEAGK